MKLDQLRKVIREEVRAAIKEELQEVLTEAVKIASKLIGTAIAALVLWYLISLGYTAYGVSDIGAEALAWVTIFVPFIVYGFFSIVWSQAKHNVWKRENELE